MKVELWILYTMFSLMIVFFVIFFFYLIAMKWVHFGWAIWFKDRKFKGNMGFLFTRSAGNNFPIPKIIDLRKQLIEMKDDSYVFAREQLQGARMFGKSYIMFEANDNKTSLGLYAHNSGNKDEDGKIIDAEPRYYMDEEGDYIIDKYGNPIPELTQVKPAVSLPTSLFKSVVTQETFKNLKKYITDLVGRYKYVLMVVVAIFIGIGVLIYFSYNQQETLPQVLAACQNAATICAEGGV